MITLEAAFIARLRAVLAADEDPARVLAYPDRRGPDGRRSAERTAALALWARHRERWPDTVYATANPDYWPAGLPLPLTVGDARAAVLDELDELSADLAAEVRRIVGACAPALDAAALLSVVNGWPVDVDGAALPLVPPVLDGWPLDVDGSPGRVALARLGNQPSWSAWPDDVAAADVLAWASDALAGALGADVLDELRELLDITGGLTTPTVDGLRWPSVGLALVFRAEREASPLHAARAALRGVRELLTAAARQDLSTCAAAVRSELEALDPGDVARVALDDDGALLLCAADLVREASRLAPLLDELRPTSDAAGLEAAGTMAAALVDVLDQLGPAGHELAGDVRASAEARAAAARALPSADPAGLWVVWAPDEPAPRWLRFLAWALVPTWRERERGERAARLEAARDATPAHPIAVVTVLQRALSTWKIETTGGRDTLVDRDGVTLAEIVPRGLAWALAAEVQRPTVGELRSVDTHRFLLWFLRELRARWLAGHRDFRAVRVDGGWLGLAELVKGDREVLRRVVPYLGRLPIPGPHDTSEPGNLYTFEPGPESRGRRRGWFTLTGGTMLHPAATRARVSWDRDTLPIPGLPPMAGVLSERGNEQGQIATLRLLTVARLEAAGAELVTKGGALISGDGWISDLNAVGLRHPIARFDRLVDAWVRGGDDAPPFLVEVERPRGERPGRYHLHPEHHTGARAYLDRGAEMARKGEADAKSKGRKPKK